MFQAYDVAPGGQVRGDIRVPGDKSISHRAIMLDAHDLGGERDRVDAGGGGDAPVGDRGGVDVAVAAPVAAGLEEVRGVRCVAALIQEPVASQEVRKYSRVFCYG